MLEQLYNDFQTKLLPSITEGLTITKDYFLDLFGRYIKYLIIIDSIKVGIGIVLLLASGIALKKLIAYGRKNGWGGDEYIPFMLFLFPIIIGTILLFNGAYDLVKDIFIPEVRIYELLLRDK